MPVNSTRTPIEMLAKLEQHAAPMTAAAVARARYLLVVLPKSDTINDATPRAALLRDILARRRKKAAELAKSALCADGGQLIAWVMIDATRSRFEQQTALRQALAPLLAENPAQLAIAVMGDAMQRQRLAELAVYCAWLNGWHASDRKKSSKNNNLQSIVVHGHAARDGQAVWRALAEGNVLCRELTLQPPNDLTPGVYRKRVKALAKQHGWRHEEFDFNQLKRMGAGAFCAVAQGSDERDAAIVHLQYRHRGAKQTVALVGKGICFDTGGHNLKPARHMQGMHEDMNGSAVALGILLAATRAKLPVNIDCWMALAQNHLSPRAYKQNEVVTALNGTTIEIVHTDAEGRMVLSDTLTLAARKKPDLIVDFATLTGSMHVALGSRYSGVFATTETLVKRAVAAGVASGERVCVFPMDDDYDGALDSSIADVKQCTMDVEADHILAARLLQRFTGKLPWIHMDLSAHSCKGGLGAVGADTNGFGVAWGLALLQGLK
jgi:leucyl aminopeptidase